MEAKRSQAVWAGGFPVISEWISRDLFVRLHSNFPNSSGLRVNDLIKKQPSVKFFTIYMSSNSRIEDYPIATFCSLWQRMMLYEKSNISTK